MNELNDDVKAAAREAVEPIKDMVQSDSPGRNGFSSENSSRDIVSTAPEVVDSYDKQLAQAVAQEKAMEKSIEHERGIEHGREM